MKIPDLFKEYIWLVNTIYQSRKISFRELSERWMETDMSRGMPLSRTTFNRHRDAVFDIFGIIIENDRKDGYRYYIYNEQVLRENSVQKWMISTISVNNIVSESRVVYDRILLENIPSGGDGLKLIIKAMKENRRLKIHYQRYQAPSGNTMEMEPYCIKLFNRRWYLLARLSDGFMATFSLDRMHDIKLLKTKFKVDKDFNAADFFKDSFGIAVDNKVKVERVVLRATGMEPYYMKDLPLHHTQRVVSETEEFTDFEVTLRPTMDFKSKLLSRGQWLKVVEPKWLADELDEMHLAAANHK